MPSSYTTTVGNTYIGPSQVQPYTYYPLTGPSIVDTSYQSLFIEKHIPSIVDEYPSNLFCNFRNAKFIVINDLVLSKIEYTKNKSFDLKYEDNAGSKKINISAIFNDEKIYTVIFSLMTGDALKKADLKFLNNFKNAFKKIFEEEVDSLCEKCVHGPRFFMESMCDKIFETIDIKEC